jgi:hypothetical protein
MPITLNHSNISIQYSTGSNYIIETVKSDLYRSNELNINNIVTNIQAAPVTPTTYVDSSNIYAVEYYTYSGSANTRDYTRVFTNSTTCDILIVGGGGGGDSQIGGGGGGGAVLYATNISIPANTYTIKVGKGGVQNENGGNSEAFGATCLGGGSTAFVAWTAQNNGTSGGSGSGGSAGGLGVPTGLGGASGTSTKGTLLNSGTLYNGNAGGNGLVQAASGTPVASGGGGGAGTAGNSSISTDYNTRQNWINAGRPSKGGDGVAINITGATYYWGAGGGGGSYNTHAGDGGLGGGGGGGAENRPPGLAGTGGINNGIGGLNTGTENGGNGAPNTGSGGGGGAYELNNGGAGGSGIVIIRYLLGTIPINNLLTIEPTIIDPVFTESITSFIHSGGAETQTTHTYTIKQNTICDILVVGGGGGGGSRAGSGGGAGAVIYLTNQRLSAGTYTIRVGNGGNGASTMGQGNKGEDSSVSFNSTNIYLAKGGGGGFHADGTGSSNKDGGSGGGNTYEGARAGNAISTNIPEGTYGNSGGSPGVGASPVSSWGAGGGGGAGQIGGNAILNGSVATCGKGGNGLPISITGNSIYYGGGGGGGGGDGCTVGGAGWGGGGTGGGNGGNGTSGTGGGGGGGGFGGGGAYNYPGGKGGSGIVILRLKSIINAAIPDGNTIINKTLKFAYSATLPNTYTLSIPSLTRIQFNNQNIQYLSGNYTITLGASQSSVLPTVSNTLRIIPLQNTATSSISISYSILNPVLDPIGAQWTYSSNNTNVYHMGSVGIGTTSPEYQLDVRGTIYSSLGGYTSSTLTKWSVLSDRRIKENIVKASYDKCLENVKNIELYNFNFKDNCVNTNDRHQLGFIAQEVQQVYPKAVEVSNMIMNLEQKIDDLLTLNITQIDYTLYGAVKSLIEKIENIKIKMEHIKTTYDIP